MRMMKKGVWLTLVAVLLVGVVAGGIWYINEMREMRTGTKDAFIPYNSAVVVSVNPGAKCPPVVEKAFAADWRNLRKKLLLRVADTLRKEGYIFSDSYVWAARVEGKSDVALLYVMDNRDILSRNEIAGFLNGVFVGGKENLRKYDRHKIYALKQGREEVYFAVCGGIILLSDSDLYIEDGLKQFDQEEAGETLESRYRNLNKYFSAGAGWNIFLNQSAFSDMLPLYMQIRKLFPHVDITRFFKWGALDGEWSSEGVCLNGFMHYGGMEKSYIRTLENQSPREAAIDRVIPARSISVGLLHLSDPAEYFTALEAYRYTVGRKERVFSRKQQLAKMFGKEAEKELQNLLQGEFAVATFDFQEAKEESDGIIMAGLKSGSLCRLLVEKMIRQYARFDGQSPEVYQKEYHVDREKSFTYYRLPAEDFATIYWGDLWEGLKCRYVLVEDNYLILASSEKAMKGFVQDYVHGKVIGDAEWYRQLKTKLAGKYNLAYFARTADVLPAYQSLATGDWQKYLSRQASAITVFPAFAIQWSNEGEMLYNTLYLSTAKIQEDVRPHVVWQTKVEGRVSQKPVSVVNHVTGERELLVQDEKHKVYLINAAGRILWSLPVDGPINSEVYQVDLFKNGKLQYLFSTSAKMYLIDRNGNAVGRFPIAFRAACQQGITVFDYDQNRNYRIFVPAADRKVYLYDLNGDLVKGWAPRKTDKPIVSKVQHYRIGNKDYIVFADQYRLYILDRRGKERVRVASVFDLRGQTDFCLSRWKGQPVLVIPATGGVIHLVNFAGQTEHFRGDGLAEDYKMTVADIDADGQDECVFTTDQRIVVCRLSGKKLWEKKLEVKGLSTPYVYRFSTQDARIGVTDSKQNLLLLLSSDGSISKGFPIAGDSPFSIVFSGTDGFFLFAGADQGTVIKYRVQR